MDLVTLSFSGSMGMKFDSTSGDVTAVSAGSAKSLGVQTGWIMKFIDGEPYSSDLLKTKRQSRKPYSVTFETKKSSHSSANANQTELTMKIFEKYDLDGSGVISEEELQSVLSALGWKKADIAMLLNLIDKDGDGQIDYEEFVQWIFDSDGEDAPVLVAFREVLDSESFAHKAEAAVTAITKRQMQYLRAERELDLESISAVFDALLHLLAGLHPSMEVDRRGQPQGRLGLRGFQSLASNPEQFLACLLKFKDSIDAGEVPVNNIERARSLTDCKTIVEKVWQPLFSREVLLKKFKGGGGRAAAGLALWVTNTIAYYDSVAERVGSGPPPPASLESVENLKSRFDAGDIAGLANAILEGVRKCDVLQYEGKHPDDIVQLAFYGGFLALCVLYGEEGAAELIGASPFTGEASGEIQDMVFTINYVKVEVSLRPFEWRNIQIQGILSALSAVDHVALQDKLSAGGDMVAEMQRLMNVYPTRASSHAASRLLAWLDVSVKPFCS